MVCHSSPILKTNDKDFDDLTGILRYELFYHCSYMCHNLSLIIRGRFGVAIKSLIFKSMPLKTKFNEIMTSTLWLKFNG